MVFNAAGGTEIPPMPTNSSPPPPLSYRGPGVRPKRPPCLGTGFARVHRLFGAWTVAVLAFLYLPVALLVVYSFNRSALNVVWAGATTHWYADLLHDAAIRTAAGHSLAVAGVTTVLATAIGTAAAWVSHRYRLPGGRAVLSLANVPIVVPDVVMGVGLLALFAATFRVANPWLAGHGVAARPTLGFATLVLAHVTFCFPFVLVGVRARLDGLDPALEEAAMDLGATPAEAFARVVLPSLWPAVASGALMSFTLSMDELIVSSFTAGDYATLPIKVYGMAKVGLTPTLNAISAVFVVATVVLMTAADRLRRRA